jgi:hypothetical protein
MKILRRLAGIAGLAFALAAGAQPAVQDRGGVKFVTGGVGEDERAAMAALRAQFNVRVTSFVPKGGNYLAEVAVTVRDANATEILATTMDGPFLYARLAPGAYVAEAKFREKTLQRKFKVPASGAIELYLPFDDPSAAWEKGMEPEREKKAGARR